LNGLFKVVYADKLLDLVPDYAILQKEIDFVPADKETGNFYAQPVNLSQEAGFTYNGSSGAVVTLNAAIAGTLKEAQVKGSELILRAQLSYTALSRASTKGEKAFKRASAWKIEDMNNSMRKRLEIAMIYGSSAGGVGIVSSVSGQVITLTAASWAGGIWAGTENHTLDIFPTSLSGAAHATGLSISAVNSDLLQLTVVGSLASVVATDVIFFASANAAGAPNTFNEMAGLQAIIQNAGVLFNIDASVFSLWKGVSVSSVGQPSLGKIQDAITRAVNKGLMEKVLCLVSPKAWGVLNTDQAALRRYDESYDGGAKLENGGRAIKYWAANGEVEVRAHPMVKDGDAFLLPIENMQRIGSIDLTFGVPGFDEQFFTLVPNNNAVEVQCMADQAIFIEKPAHAVYMSGLTYA